MFQKPARLLFPIVLMGLIPACALSGTWPNLSDEIPDASDRVRVIERTAVSNTVETEPAPVLSADDAASRLSEIMAAINQAERNYAASLRTFEESTSETATVRAQLWLEAQLTLTRFSQSVSTLDQLIEAPTIKASPQAEQASTAKKSFDQIIDAERRNLEKIKPATFNNAQG